MKIKFLIAPFLLLFLQEIKSQNTKSLGISIEPSIEKAIYWTKSKDFKTPASFGFRIGVCYQVNVPKFKYSIGLTYADRALKHQQNNLIFGSDIRGGTTSSMKSSTQVKEIGVGGLVQRKVKDNASSKWQPVIGGGLEINKTVKNTNRSWIALGNGDIEEIASIYNPPSFNIALLAAQGIELKLNPKHYLALNLLERVGLLSGFFNVSSIKTNHFSIGFNVKYLFSLN